MANCPKCNAHLKVTDWRQHCPHCGANIVVYDLQERLMQQADVAEVQYYHFQKKIDRLKASFIGTKLAVVRIITSLLPVAAVFLPLISGVIRAPFPDYEGNVSALTIYNAVGSLNGDVLSGLLSDELKASSVYLIVSLVFLLLSILMILVHFILLILACSKHAKVRGIIEDTIIIITSFGAAIAFAVMPKDGAVDASLSYGVYLYLLLQVVNVAVDLIVLFKGIPVHHKQCYVGGIPIEEYFELCEKLTPEEIREEQYKRLRAIQEEKEEKIREDEEKKHHSENLTEEEAGTDE